jgi:iron complex transport system ATP-binding protein
MSDEVLRLRGVEVRRDAAVLLRDVDWTAHENERWILIGPNGAGKTTLLQVAATMVFASAGTVEVLGERLGEVDVFDLRPRIGLTSAAIAEQVPPGEKVIDLVLTASYAILGRWKEEYDSADVTRAVELLDALGCAHLIRRKFATLSEGERKRVQIARALMPDPELLLLDEPAAGLDLGGREDLLRRLSMLARDPKAPMMVLVTHHVEEVPDGFTHAMLLRRGAVLAAGPIEDVFTARNLSRCFGVQLEIEHRQNRWTARAKLLRSHGRGRSCTMPSSLIRVSNDGCRAVAGPCTTCPESSRNVDPCHGHTTHSPLPSAETIRPWCSGPPRCAHRSAST